MTDQKLKLKLTTKRLIAKSMARPAGFEPATVRLEGGCSIQLSYGRLIKYPSKRQARKWSEWRDSNPRHSAPKADALPGCATLRHMTAIAMFREASIIHTRPTDVND